MMKNSIEWSYRTTHVLPEDIVECIAAQTDERDWMRVSARLSDLYAEAFCEQHGKWEPYNEPCSGAVERLRLTDTQPTLAALPIMKAYIAAERSYIR